MIVGAIGSDVRDRQDAGGAASAAAITRLAGCFAVLSNGRPSLLEQGTVELSQPFDARVYCLGQPSPRRRRHPGKPQGGKIQLVDEHLDHPNRVLLIDVIRLPPVRAALQWAG
jgi:hypothetical protein